MEGGGFSSCKSFFLHWWLGTGLVLAIMENAGERKVPIKLSYTGKSVRKCVIIAQTQYYCIQSQLKEVEDRIVSTEKALRKLMKELHDLKKEERYQSLIVCIMSDLVHDRHISIRENEEESSGGIVDLLNDPSSSDDEPVEDMNMSNQVSGVSKVVTPVKKLGNVVSLKRNAEDVSEVMSERKDMKFSG